MSNIRPIGDPAIATAMLATMQSIDAARSAPSGISEPRWRILQCIAKAAPNVPTPGELRMCSGLNKAALAEHVQALQWKGLLEMGGYRLSPSAAEMVGIAQPYPPKDAKAMVIVEHGPRDDDAVVAIQHAIAAMGIKDMPILPPEPVAPVFIGVDIAARPDVSIEARVTFGADGKIAKIEPLTPMDPADVPACMRPDCTAPEAKEIPNGTGKGDQHRRSGNHDGIRGSALDAVVAPSTAGTVSDRHGIGAEGRCRSPRLCTLHKARPVSVDRDDHSAVDRQGSASELGGTGSTAVARRPSHDDASAGLPHVSSSRIREIQGRKNSNPSASNDAVGSQVSATPKFVSWIEQRRHRIESAIRFLKSKAILVTVVDRDAQVRQYFVSGKRDRKFAEEVIEIAIEKGWVE